MRFGALARLTPVMVMVFTMLGCATTGRVVKDEGDKGWISVDHLFNSGPIAVDVAREFCRQRGLGFTYTYNQGMVNPRSFDNKVVGSWNLGFDVSEGRIYKFDCDPKRQSTSFTPQPAQQQTQETDRLRAEAEAAKQRQRQLEEQLNQSRSPSVAPVQTATPTSTDRLTLDASKKKCVDLGFKPSTEAFGKCVLQLSK